MRTSNAGTGEKCGRPLGYADRLPCSQEIIGISGVTPYACPLDTGSAIGATGTGVSFALSSAINSSISHCACCSPIRLDASQSMVLLGA